MNTSYVPLEHPYRIIAYRGVLGIQIGTLIVTVDKSEESKGGYAIETHSHPVVSYVNNSLFVDKEEHRSLSLPKPYEGVVWDKVELQDVETVVRENEQLSWYTFMEYCRRLWLSELEGILKNVDGTILNNYGLLKDWGIDIGLPKGALTRDKTLRVELDGIDNVCGHEYIVTEGDLGIVVKNGDKNIMITQIIRQVDFYLMLMAYYDIANCEVKFWTQNLFMRELTEELNERWKRHHQKLLSYQLDDEDGYGMLYAAEDIANPNPDR